MCSVSGLLHAEAAKALTEDPIQTHSNEQADDTVVWLGVLGHSPPLGRRYNNWSSKGDNYFRI